MGQIPLVMFCAGIGYLDETSVNEFFYRVNLGGYFGVSNGVLDAEFFRKYMPMTTNIETITRTKWLTQRFGDKNISTKWAKKVDSRKHWE